ncbi:MAG TPA: diacylglycerol kinase family protein [Anaerolineales bacterium]|nr:diacylglycerol kinase family protein [Anaerolineales bacterium]
MMRATVIYNPRAGRFNVAHMLPPVCSELGDLGWDVQFCTVGEGRDNDINAIAGAACDRRADAVFVAGGDGSVGAAAAVLSGSGVAMGVLPCGTGNVWARGLGLAAPAHPWSAALLSAALRQAKGSVRNVDLGSCNGRVFLQWAGVGLDGHIVRGVEPRGRIARCFGRWHYIARGVWLARSWRGASMRLRGGNTGFEGEMLATVATNVPAYAGGLATLEPEVRAQDGRLALWAFRGKGFGDALAQVARLLSGRHQVHRNVERVVAASFQLESEKELPLQLDGEPAGAAMRFEIKVAPRTLRVLVPHRLGSIGWPDYWR